MNYVIESNPQFSDLTDEERAFLMDMSIDAQYVYSQHKFDFGKTRQMLRVTLKPNFELRRQRLSKFG